MKRAIVMFFAVLMLAGNIGATEAVCDKCGSKKISITAYNSKDVPIRILKVSNLVKEFYSPKINKFIIKCKKCKNKTMFRA